MADKAHTEKTRNISVYFVTYIGTYSKSSWLVRALEYIRVRTAAVGRLYVFGGSTEREREREREEAYTESTHVKTK